LIRAAIFDFDGTLTPLTLDFGVLRAAIEEMAKGYVGEELVAAQSGQYIIEIIHAVDDMLGSNCREFKERAFRLLCDLELDAADGKSLYPYGRNVLALLKKKGLSVAIITRTCADVIKKVFPDVHDYVDVIVTREDIRYVKPNPEHVRVALELIGIEPAFALLTGDHPTDIQAGRAAGTVTVGVLTGRTAREQFLDAGADHVFEDIRGVTELIDNIGNNKGKR